MNMAIRYQIRGQWDPDVTRPFYGRTFNRFLAELPARQAGAATITVAVWLPIEYKSANCGPGQIVDLELEPGTYLMQLVPFTLIVGDPTGLPREPVIQAEDVMVERISIRAIPAS
jgi:hypothetical protein